MAEDLKKIFTIDVDTIKSANGKGQNVAFSQGDVKTAILIINIKENETALELTGMKIRASFKKPDATNVYQDLTTGITVLSATTGQIQIVLSSDVLSAVGSVRGQISITDDVGGLVAETTEFSFFVRESIINTAILSSNDLPVMEKLVDTAEVLDDVTVDAIVNFENSLRLPNRQEWMSTEGQNTFTITSGTIESDKLISVTVGGVVQHDIVLVNATTFTIGGPLPTGISVVAEWWNSRVLVSETHKSAHELGGIDEIDITKLKNYDPTIPTKVNQLTTDLAQIKTFVKPPNTIVLLGDSITEGNEISTAGYDSKGFFVWANTILGQRLKVLNCAGVGGQRIDGFIPRLKTDVLDYKPGWCLVEGGTNDIGQGRTSTQITTDLKTIYDTLMNAGIRVVACTIPPGTYFDTVSEKSVLYSVNRWIRNYARENQNIVVADIHGAIADPETSSPLTGMTTDGVHPSPEGAARMGKVVADSFNTFVPPVDLLPQSNADTTNLLTNGMLTGNVSGLATSWIIQNYGGFTYTASKVNRNDNVRGEWQQLAITAGAGAIVQTISTGWAVGEKVEAYVEFETDDNFVNVSNFYAEVVFLNASSGTVGRTASLYRDGAYTSFVFNPRKGIFYCPAMVIPANTANIQLVTKFNGAGTIRIGRSLIQKVI